MRKMSKTAAPTIAETIPKGRQKISRRVRRAKFGLEWLAPRLQVDKETRKTSFAYEWKEYHWYPTEEQREQALAQLNKNQNHLFQFSNEVIRYRPINRD